ncbi:hypothetical protein N9M39_00640 [Halieaceae bacterium]|nr:hypothetical protein [Halieaceae bacterium]
MNAIRLLESVGVLDGKSDLGEWVSQQLADKGEANLSVCLPTKGGNVSFLDSGNESSAFIGGGESSARALAASLRAGGNGGGSKCNSGSITTLSLSAISATAAGPAEGKEAKDAEKVKEIPTEGNEEVNDQYLVVRLVVTPQ